MMTEKPPKEKQDFGLEVEDRPPTPQRKQQEEAEARIERQLKLKLDFIILPCLALAYFLSSMGRSDIANAKTAGMTEDLGLSPKQYSDIASIFNVGYVLFQIPGTILVRKITPPLQFAGAMIVWGVVTVCHVKATTYGTIMGLRVIVGAAEAFLEGGVFYLSWWYTYTELASRGAIFYSMSALAGSFNGLIAYAIQKNLDGHLGWTAWQWIYFVEGILPIGCSFILLILMPHHPEKKHWIFTKEEQDLAVRRSRAAFNPVDAKIRLNAILSPLLEVRFWLLSAIYAFNHYANGALRNFLPPIIQGFGYSAADSQLISVVVYACALVGINVFAQIADRLDRRGIALLMASGVTILGYILLLAIENYKARLAATCILATGIFATIPISTTWLTMNIAGFTRRGSATAMMNMVAQAFAISGTQAYIDPPLYRKGNASALGLMCAHVLATLAMLWSIKRANAAKEKVRSELPAEELERRRAESWDILGDRHIDFKYGY